MNTGHAGETVVVGRVLGAWGVQGWVRVYSYTDPPEALFDYAPWLLGQPQNAIVPIECRRSGQRLLARLPGIDTPEAAAALTEQQIAVARSLLPPPPDDSYYWHDLVGLEVFNLEGHRWGRVARLLPTGAHDVLQIERESGSFVLIPFVSGRFVHSVDLAVGRITVDWPLDWED